MRLVFFGTESFSAVVLDRLLNTRHEVAAVVTQPDKKRGRNQEVVFSPVKKRAFESQIKVLQYERISKQDISGLSAIGADVFVTAAFGQILPQTVLDMPPKGVINVHASLLPKYRGSAPIQWALINGEKETGITIMKTDFEVDSGDILLKKSTPIKEGETAGELFDRLSELGADALIEALGLIERGEAVYTPQNHSAATRYPKLEKKDGKIDFNLSAQRLADFIAGMTPWPSAYTYLEGKLIKIYKISPTEGKGRPGEVLKANSRDGLEVAVDGGAVRILELQPENGKRMNAKSYLLGHSIQEGTQLGE